MTDDYDPRDWYDRADERGKRATGLMLAAGLCLWGLVAALGKLAQLYREAEEDHGAAAAAANVARARAKAKRR